MIKLTEYIYIQNIIHYINGEYIIFDRDLSLFFNYNVINIFDKYKKLFLKDYYYFINGRYAFNIDGIIIFEFILNNYIVSYKVDMIILYMESCIQIQKNCINKISIKKDSILSFC